MLLCGCNAAENDRSVPAESPPVTEAVATLEPQQVLEADSGNRWHSENMLVAHALGAVEGRLETNSMEAFVESYESGHRVFEADLVLTDDNRLVARHDFEQISYYNLEQVVRNAENTVMSYEQFMSEKINYMYTPLDIEGLIGLLCEYPDAYLITDTKNTDAESIELQFSQLADAVKACGDESVYSRIIVQIYNDEMYDAVSGIYPFENWIYTTYQLAEPDYDAIAEFCVEHKIEVVVTPMENAKKAVNDRLHAYGLKVYYHTTNRLMAMKHHYDLGGDGFYTDIVCPDDLQYAGITMR